MLPFVAATMLFLVYNTLTASKKIPLHGRSPKVGIILHYNTTRMPAFLPVDLLCPETGVCWFVPIFNVLDFCFRFQIYAIIGDTYAKDSAPAFALFKFVQVGDSIIRNLFVFASHQPRTDENHRNCNKNPASNFLLGPSRFRFVLPIRTLLLKLLFCN